MNLSKQALGALMLALQKSLMQQEDIVPMLLDFDFSVNSDGELFVKNPPTVDLSESKEVDYTEVSFEEETV